MSGIRVGASDNPMHNDKFQSIFDDSNEIESQWINREIHEVNQLFQSNATELNQIISV